MCQTCQKISPDMCNVGGEKHWQLASGEELIKNHNYCIHNLLLHKIFTIEWILTMLTLFENIFENMLFF